MVTPSFVAQLDEVRREQPRRDQAEGIVMGSGSDRRQDLLRLGRREDEPQMGRRLLDQLEQRIEALSRDHVGLIDDVDLVGAGHRCEEGLLAQVAGVVDSPVRGGIDLDDIDGSWAATRQVLTALALTTGIRDRRLLAVQRTSQDPSRGRLAAATRAGEQVGVIHPVVGQRRAQRGRDVILPNDFGERLRPVAAIKREGCIHS